MSPCSPNSLLHGFRRANSIFRSTSRPHHWRSADPVSSVCSSGSLIGFWGRTKFCPRRIERFMGILGWLVTVSLCCPAFSSRSSLRSVSLGDSPAWCLLEKHVFNMESALAEHEVERRAAVSAFVHDRKKQPGINDGIPVSLIAGVILLLFFRIPLFVPFC